MVVDFHVHSTASDGTFSPAELADRARGFAAVALTDHDNCDGLVEFMGRGGANRVAVSEAAARQGRHPVEENENRPLRVPGIELSIEPGAGFDKFHLLGLGIDPANAELKALLRRVLDGRNARNERIIANFRRIGFSMDGVEELAHGEVLARPHFARWLVDHGVEPDVRTAFEKYLLADSPRTTRCYEERWHPSQEETFRVIHAAGGLCVMAHPKYWRNEWKTVGPDYAAAERELAALKERGLDGVETLYQANTDAENVEFTRIAMRLGYLTTAGSDFHGANKPTIRLGMEVTEPFIMPVLERLAR